MQPVPDVAIYKEGPEWEEGRRQWRVDVHCGSSGGEWPRGRNELQLWLLEPGVVVQKMAIDFFGGLKPR